MPDSAPGASRRVSRVRNAALRVPGARFRVAWDGMVLDCNEAFARICGAVSPRDLIGQSIKPFHVDPELRPRLLARLAAEGSLPATPVGLRRPSGEVIWVHAVATRVLGEHGEPEIVGAAVDITELKEAADALVEREAQISSILRTAGMPIICTDLDARIVVFNPAAEQIFGVRREQVLGTEYPDLFPPQVRPKVRADLERIAAGGGISFENAITRPDGVRAAILWNMQAMTDRHGVSRGVLAVGQDITLRQRMEEALYGQLQLLRRLSTWLGDPATNLDDLRTEVDRATAALRFHLDERMLPTQPVDRLTRREREVFSYLARGLTNAEIARALDVSIRTVETHRSHLMAKLGLRGPRELVHYAIRCGIAPPHP